MVILFSVTSMQCKSEIESHIYVDIVRINLNGLTVLIEC